LERDLVIELEAMKIALFLSHKSLGGEERLIWSCLKSLSIQKSSATT
jgi:hypothetical protein